MFIHERFVYERLPLTSELSNLEMVMCAVKLPPSHPLLIGSVYRPPDDKKYLEQLSASKVLKYFFWVISIYIFYRQKENNLSIE